MSEKLAKLAEILDGIDNSDEKSEFAFDMRREFRHAHVTNHPCGTAACIGGWAKRIFPEVSSDESVDVLSEIAPEFSIKEIRELAFPDISGNAWRATPQQAAKAIRILISTGKCDWPEAMKA